jgi:hypothetical protein
MPKLRTSAEAQLCLSFPGQPCARGEREGPAQREGEGQQAEVTYYASRKVILHQCSRGRAVFQALATAGAFGFLYFIEVAWLEQCRADRRFRAHLPT